MVTLGRLELPTRSLGNCCSIHLSYRATFPEFTLALLVFGAAVMHPRHENENAARKRRFHKCVFSALQRGLDLESPRFQQRFRNVFGIPIPAGPLAQPRGSNVLIRCKLVLFDHLLKRGHGRDHRSDGLRLAPVWISTTLCHLVSVSLGRIKVPAQACSGVRRGDNPTLLL